MNRSVYMHGFTVDEKNRKMSKSLRNVFDPDLIVNGGKNLATLPAFGVNVLRLVPRFSASFVNAPPNLQLPLSLAKILLS